MQPGLSPDPLGAGGGGSSSLGQAYGQGLRFDHCLAEKAFLVFRSTTDVFSVNWKIRKQKARTHRNQDHGPPATETGCVRCHVGFDGKDQLRPVLYSHEVGAVKSKGSAASWRGWGEWGAPAVWFWVR